MDDEYFHHDHFERGLQVYSLQVYLVMLEVHMVV